jgi:hypothetical protein
VALFSMLSPRGAPGGPKLATPGPIRLLFPLTHAPPQMYALASGFYRVFRMNLKYDLDRDACTCA